jgi:hypothetical protein
MVRYVFKKSFKVVLISLQSLYYFSSSDRAAANFTPPAANYTPPAAGPLGRQLPAARPPTSHI